MSTHDAIFILDVELSTFNYNYTSIFASLCRTILYRRKVWLLFICQVSLRYENYPLFHWQLNEWFYIAASSGRLNYRDRAEFTWCISNATKTPAWSPLTAMRTTARSCDCNLKLRVTLSKFQILGEIIAELPYR